MTEDTKRDRGILTMIGRCLHTGSTSLEGSLWKLKINLGIDIEYIIKNEDLSVVGRGSSESKARNKFQEEFWELCEWCWGEETLPKIIQKKKNRILNGKINYVKGYRLLKRLQALVKGLFIKEKGV